MLIGKGDQILLCFLKTRRSFISWLYMVGWVKCVYNWLQVSLQNMHLTRLHTLSLPRSRTRAQKLTISPNGINKKWRLHAESHCADFLHVNDFHGLSGRSVTTLASPRSSNAAHFFGPLQLWYLITPTDLKPCYKVNLYRAKNKICRSIFSAHAWIDIFAYVTKQNSPGQIHLFCRLTGLGIWFYLCVAHNAQRNSNV